MSRLFHHDAKPAVTRAVSAAGTLYTLSTIGDTSIEDIPAATEGPNMFQIYHLRVRVLTGEFVKHRRAAGYPALCLTVDAARAGNRERDLKTNMTLPPRSWPRRWPRGWRKTRS
jgi:L-lactate dehydrogenase (cytochrome)